MPWGLAGQLDPLGSILPKGGSENGWYLQLGALLGRLGPGGLDQTSALIASIGEALYHNTDFGTCHDEAVVNAWLGIASGYGVDAVHMSPSSGPRHVVAQLTEGGTSTFLSWGEVYHTSTSIGDSLWGAGNYETEVESGEEFVYWALEVRRRPPSDDPLPLAVPFLDDR
jgi:hypothetical protein